MKVCVVETNVTGYTEMSDMLTISQEASIEMLEVALVGVFVMGHVAATRSTPDLLMNPAATLQLYNECLEHD